MTVNRKEYINRSLRKLSYQYSQVNVSFCSRLVPRASSDIYTHSERVETAKWKKVANTL